MHQILFSTEIALCGLNGCVAKEHLNLRKLTAAGAAQFRASTAEIMGGDTRDSRSVGVGFDKLPDDLLAQGFACDSASAIYRTEDVTVWDGGWRCPRKAAPLGCDSGMEAINIQIALACIDQLA